MFGFGKKKEKGQAGKGLGRRKAKAEPSIITDRQREAFTVNKSPEIEVYVHIPFCVRKCLYCDFLSAPAEDMVQKEQYVQDLIREITLTAEEVGARNYIVRSIFFGGGTPSSLEAKLLVDILTTIQKTFSVKDDAEITLEVNPGTVTPDSLKLLRTGGFNRVSIGIQSMDDGLLEVLGRIHSAKEAQECAAWAREAGFSNVSVDIMSGLPNQSLEQWHDTIERVIAMEPDHISAYSLIVEDGTPFAGMYRGEGAAALPDEDTERQMYYDTYEYLHNAGYERYEISNYAKPGFACIHNLGYWTGVDYLGFGLGASSLWDRTRYHNVNTHTKYHESLSAGNIAGLREDVMKLSRQECMEEHMFLGLRCMKGISKKEFEQKFGVVYETVLGPATARLLRKGLISCEGDNIRLTTTGIDVSNQVFAEFLIE